MKKISYWQMLVAIVVLLCPNLHAQEVSNQTQWYETVEKRKQQGTFEGFQCFDDFGRTPNLEKGLTPCAAANAGYGTTGWTPQSSPETNNFDPACAVTLPGNTCNGGKYRIPIRNVIFECPDWEGDNYTEDDGGFKRMPDYDLDIQLSSVNEYYAKANIEFVEVERVRIENCDMYDFYWRKWGKDPNNEFNDSVNDEQQLPNYDKPNTINMYWVGGFNRNHSCCGILGYVDKPPSERDYGVMRYSVSVNPSYLHHELSHYFGNYHTHWNLDAYNNVKGFPDTKFDNSDCLTTGDGICDTWPDPNFETKCGSCGTRQHQHCYKDRACGFDMNAFACEKGERLTIDPNTGSDIDLYTSTVLRQNFTTYNNHECRSTFTPCQYFKMNAVAQDCRNHLYISDPKFYFEDVADTLQVVQEGRNMLMKAGKTQVGFDGSSYELSCFNWFLNEDDLTSEAVASATNQFDPSPYIDGVGNYTFYLSEVNSLSNPPAKIPIQLTVVGTIDDDVTCEDSHPGDIVGDAGYLLGGGTTTLTLETADPQFTQSDEAIAWWVTREEPVSTQINTQSELEAAIDLANNNTPLDKDADIIYATENGSLELNVNCANLEEGVSYFATPLVMKTVNGSSVDYDCTGNFKPISTRLSSGEAVSLAMLRRGSISCATTAAPKYQLEVEVEGYNGNARDFRLYLVPQINSNLIHATTSGGDGIYRFNETDLDGYDPNSKGLRVAVFEQGGNAGKDVTVTVTLNITYGDLTVTTSLTATYTDCVFGDPVSFKCISSLGGNPEPRQATIQQSIAVHPSPAKGGTANLAYYSNQAGELTIEVYDTQGERRRQWKQAVLRGEQYIDLPVAELRSGIYLLKVVQQGRMQTTRFSIVR